MKLDFILRTGGVVYYFSIHQIISRIQNPELDMDA